MYFDSPRVGSRIKINNSVHQVSTLPATAAINDFYIVTGKNTLHMYTSTGWVEIVKRPQFHIKNVIVTGGAKTINKSGILATDTAKFIPDLSVSDLVAETNCTCGNGTVRVSGLNTAYDIPGEIIVNPADVGISDTDM